MLAFRTVTYCTENEETPGAGVHVLASKPVRVVVPKCRYHYVVEVVCGERPPLRGRDDHDDRGDHPEGPGGGQAADLQGDLARVGVADARRQHRQRGAFWRA